MQFQHNRTYDICDGATTIRCKYDERSKCFAPIASYFSGYFALGLIRADYILQGLGTTFVVTEVL
jgi:hypothetical protein